MTFAHHEFVWGLVVPCVQKMQTKLMGAAAFGKCIYVKEYVFSASLNLFSS